MLRLRHRAQRPERNPSHRAASANAPISTKPIGKIPWMLTHSAWITGAASSQRRRCSDNTRQASKPANSKNENVCGSLVCSPSLAVTVRLYGELPAASPATSAIATA